jgi:hypothetical protein
MKSLYESGGEGCPYDSVHRAKAAMILLNVAFSKMIASSSSDGTFNSASLGSTVALYHTTGPSSSAPKLRRGAASAQKDTSKENTRPGTLSTGLSSDEDFDKLTVAKVMKMISLNSASELRGMRFRLNYYNHRGISNPLSLLFPYSFTLRLVAFARRETTVVEVSFRGPAFQGIYNRILASVQPRRAPRSHAIH